MDEKETQEERVIPPADERFQGWDSHTRHGVREMLARGATANEIRALVKSELDEAKE